MRLLNKEICFTHQPKTPSSQQIFKEHFSVALLTMNRLPMIPEYVNEAASIKPNRKNALRGIREKAAEEKLVMKLS